MAAFEDIVSVHYHETPDARFRVLQAGGGPDIVWVPERLIAQWQPCLDCDATEALATSPVPVHAIAFSEDIQTPPGLVRKVADAARHGHYHELAGLGHVSLNRHAPQTVNACLASLIAGYG